MKFNLLCILGLACLIALCNARPADEEYSEYVDEPAPPAPPAPKPTRPNPLKNRRNPLSGRSNGKTTTTTTAASVVEESEIDEEPLDENVEAAAPTTEAPKKFKAGSVRPFRSNDDLLAALKRRREQAASHKPAAKATHQEEEAAPVEAAPAPSKNRVNSGRKRFNHNKSAESGPEENAATPAPARAARRFPGRN